MLWSLVITVAFSLGATHAYKIDPESCGDNAPFLRSALFDAFEMAKGAVDALDASRRDPNVDRLVELLFCTADDDPSTVDLSSVRNSLAGAYAMRTEAPGLDEMRTKGAALDFVR